MVFGGSNSKMLICQWFFNGFEGSGIENVDFSLVCQWFWGGFCGAPVYVPVPGTDPPHAPGEDSGILFTT